MDSHREHVYKQHLILLQFLLIVQYTIERIPLNGNIAQPLTEDNQIPLQSHGVQDMLRFQEKCHYRQKQLDIGRPK